MTLAVASTITGHPHPSRPALLAWLEALSERGGSALPSEGSSASRADPALADASASLDAEDVQLALGGDGDAFERIVRRHQQEVARRLWRFCRDPLIHEELVHETFVQAFISLRSYRNDAPMTHWLHRIAVRAVYRYWKQKRTEHACGPLGDHDPPAGMRHERVSLEAVLERLAPRDRLVVTLLHLEERSVAQVAQLTGWSRAMVKVQAFRARRRLRTIILGLSPGELP